MEFIKAEIAEPLRTVSGSEKGLDKGLLSEYAELLFGVLEGDRARGAVSEFDSMEEWQKAIGAYFGLLSSPYVTKHDVAGVRMIRTPFGEALRLANDYRRRCSTLQDALRRQLITQEETAKKLKQAEQAAGLLAVANAAANTRNRCPLSQDAEKMLIVARVRDEMRRGELRGRELFCLQGRGYRGREIGETTARKWINAFDSLDVEIKAVYFEAVKLPEPGQLSYVASRGAGRIIRSRAS